MTLCKIEDCTYKILAKGMCAMHYQRVRGISNVPLLAPRQRAEHGTGSIDEDGYRIIYKWGRRIGEHRWVMENYLGRRLTTEERVHHLNGNRLDNRFENLELWSISQPAGQRVEDKIEWAKEFLEQYGYTINALQIQVFQ